MTYDDIRSVVELPGPVEGDERRVVIGWAAELTGNVGAIMVFFAHLEPALAFGRAGRMSGFDVSGYGVFPAAYELRFDQGLGRDVHVLHVTGNRVDRGPDELMLLTRWLEGTNPRSSHFCPPDH